MHVLPVFYLKLELSSLELSHVIYVSCLNGNPIGSSHLCLLVPCLGLATVAKVVAMWLDLKKH